VITGIANPVVETIVRADILRIGNAVLIRIRRRWRSLGVYNSDLFGAESGSGEAAGVVGQQ
jgi:hypothetical protein